MEEVGVLKDGESEGEGGVLPSSHSQGCEGHRLSHTWASLVVPRTPAPSEGLSLPAFPAQFPHSPRLTLSHFC